MGKERGVVCLCVCVFVNVINVCIHTDCTCTPVLAAVCVCSFDLPVSELFIQGSKVDLDKAWKKDWYCLRVLSFSNCSAALEQHVESDRHTCCPCEVAGGREEYSQLC